ncbi:hypothetical protein DXG03_008346 [Asterophora parasitica]|uniref:Uncharacterized protein n=1 Tax=Asterophora parasitica TaxID=117018 RepID=A0A9P7G5H9_9AGAR|nr:hypothetical protein DXG03_008346 [Asterophora parasitica]
MIKGFFDNTGAVAGVFSVVGLVVVALVIALITNVVRRRRAKRFDREIAEAAAEAAAAPAPIFLDDDDDRRGYVGGGYDADGGYAEYGARGPYSDVSSHGTYAQPPMSHGHESYGMREMGMGLQPGEIYNPYGTVNSSAGMAGAGVARARSTRDPSAGLQEGSTPYPAFARPGYHGASPYASPANNMGDNPAAFSPQPRAAATGFDRGPGSPEYDLLEAAGMGAGAGGQRGISLNHDPHAVQQPYLSNPYQPSSQAELLRNPSQARSAESAIGSGYTSPGLSGSPPPKEAAPYAQHYAVPVEEDAYGGYVEDHHPQASGHTYGAQGRYESDEEEVEVPRVLKVRFRSVSIFGDVWS